MKYYTWCLHEQMLESDEIADWIGKLFFENKDRIMEHQPDLMKLKNYLEETKNFPKLEEFYSIEELKRKDLIRRNKAELQQIYKDNNVVNKINKKYEK